MPRRHLPLAPITALALVPLAIAPLGAEAGQRVVVYSGPVDWYAHRHTFATLQGIVNRDGPILYLAEPFFYHAG